MEGLTEILKLVALTGAAVGATAVIWRALILASRFLVRLSSAAHVVLYELQPNAGTSIKDKINTIDVRVGALEAWRLKHDD